MKTSVACIAVKGGKVLLAHRIDKGEMALRWEFPGGKAEENENAREAASREMMEEFAVEILIHEKIASVPFTHKGEERILEAYAITIAQNEKAFVLSEHTEYEWISLSEAEKRNLVDSDRKLLPYIASWIEKQK